jgi:sulfur relay (sulfurtransferase) DsrF/TusC family protein
LPELKNQGIAPEEVAVIMIQDGILKLVKNKQKRSFEKRDRSMV